MLDERSFSVQSFDARSWLGILIDAIVKRFRKQVFILKSQVDIFIKQKPKSTAVKKRAG